MAVYSGAAPARRQQQIKPKLTACAWPGQRKSETKKDTLKPKGTTLDFT
jgi:hypothetical protein